MPSPKARLTHLVIIAGVIMALEAVTFVVNRQTDDPLLIGYWCFGALVILLCLVAFHFGRRYLDREPASGRVLCIIPAYNEDQDNLVGCVRSILAQTIAVDIEVIDDGSGVPILPFEHPRVTWRRQPNTGKRGAQVEVLKAHGRKVAGRWRSNTYQFVLTVDSDSRPAPDALEHLLRAMSNPKIQAATGMIYIRNYGDSLVARAADIDIGTSCVMMRASRSILGCLETTSGALAIYRADLLYDHLEAYAVECGTGDDRWLALRALERGQVVGVAEALVETDMPANLTGTYRQRLRWARSWWWMLPYVFKNLDLRQLISPTYGMLQLVIAPAITLWALGGIVAGAISGHERYSGGKGLLALGVYLGAYVIVRWGLSGLYLVGRPGMPAREKWLSFLIGTPAAILLNLLLLTPTRYVALFKLFDNRWQTRTSKAAPVNYHVARHDPEATPTLVMPVLRDLDGRPLHVPVPRQPRRAVTLTWSRADPEATAGPSHSRR
ncbi:glycosyltransferase family 2 protein [Actinoplanes sp. CA-030573]|uniref:glycosyltransferase family 2 protein n=1 Tax=Actinoplanes sp. CA-030573 TaxID=3239898 RepID=UPI003D8E7020